MDGVLHVDTIILYLLITLFCIQRSCIYMITKPWKSIQSTVDKLHIMYILVLDDGEWSVSHSYHTWGNNSHYPLNRRLSGLWKLFECGGTDENSFPPCQKSDLDCLSCRCSLYWLSYLSCFLQYYFAYKMIIHICSSLSYIHFNVCHPRCACK